MVAQKIPTNSIKSQKIVFNWVNMGQWEEDVSIHHQHHTYQYMDLSQYLGHDLWEFFRDSSGWVSHRFDQPSNQNRLTADRSDEVEALWKSRKKNVGGS